MFKDESGKNTMYTIQAFKTSFKHKFPFLLEESEHARLEN